MSIDPSTHTLLTCLVASILTSVAVATLLPKVCEPRDVPTSSKKTVNEPKRSGTVRLDKLKDFEIPRALRIDSYISPDHLSNFRHKPLFERCIHIVQVLSEIGPYLDTFFRMNKWNASVPTFTLQTLLGDKSRDWISPKMTGASSTNSVIVMEGVEPKTFHPDRIVNEDLSTTADDAQHNLIVSPGTVVLGGTFDLTGGSIHLEEAVRIEPGVYIKGPAIIGAKSTIRSGAYLRGNVILGSHVVVRGEMKNAVALDYAELCHPGYCGDSICGYKSHFGNQVTTANLKLISSNVVFQISGQRIDSGLKKMGVVLGDESQLGCSSVTDPGTMLLPRTIAYPLSRLPQGVYGPDMLIKNNPLRAGVMEMTPLR